MGNQRKAKPAATAAGDATLDDLANAPAPDGADSTVETAAEFEAQIHRPAVAELEARVAELEAAITAAGGLDVLEDFAALEEANNDLVAEVDELRPRILELEQALEATGNRNAELEAGAPRAVPLVAVDYPVGAALLTVTAQRGLGSPGMALARAASLALTDAGLDDADLIIIAAAPGRGQEVRDLVSLGPVEEAAA